MEEEPKQSIQIQRIYLKDASLETPGTPQVFGEEYQPKIDMDLNFKYADLEKGYFEAIIHVTISAKKDDKTIFLVEAQQAGIFYMEGFKEEEQKHVLNIYCPTVLFPYAREVISDLTTRASFPPLYLAPVNFDMLYRKQLQEQSKKTQLD